jgi:hypothetical protein
LASVQAVEERKSTFWAPAETARARMLNTITNPFIVLSSFLKFPPDAGDTLTIHKVAAMAAKNDIPKKTEQIIEKKTHKE